MNLCSMHLFAWLPSSLCACILDPTGVKAHIKPQGRDFESTSDDKKFCSVFFPLISIGEQQDGSLYKSLLSH